MQAFEYELEDRSNLLLLAEVIAKERDLIEIDGRRGGASGGEHEVLF